MNEWMISHHLELSIIIIITIIISLDFSLIFPVNVASFADSLKFNEE